MSPRRKCIDVFQSKTKFKMTKMKLRSANQNCFCKIATNISKKLALHKLMTDKDFVDLTIHTNDGTQKTMHGLVFGSLPDDIMEENREWQLDLSTDALNILIEVVYHKTNTVTKDSVEALLQLANTYNIDLLKKLCGDFILQNMSKESFSTYYSLCNGLCSHIKEKINKFAKVNFRSLIKDGHINCDMEDFENWLDADDLNMEEDELLEFIMSMTNTVDQSKMPIFLQYIRFTLLGSSYFKIFFTKSLLIQSILNTQYALKRRINAADKYYRNKRKKAKQRDKLRFPADLVLVSGGWSDDGPINNIDIWDIRAEKWAPTDLALPFGNRAYHKMVCLDHNIYLVGGCEKRNDLQDTLYSLDLNTMAWKELSFMLTKRCYVSATTLGKNLVVVGGFDGRQNLRSAEIYDPNTNQWENLPDMTRGRSHAACLELEGSVFAIGGLSEQGVLNEIEIWNPITGQWRLSYLLTSPRSEHSAVVLDGRIYMVGGFDGNRVLKTVECFTPGPLVTWHQVPDMHIERKNFAMSVIEGKILVCGGSGYSQRPMGRSEMYSPKTNRWSMIPKLAIGRSALASVFVPEAPNIQSLLNRKS